MTYEKFKTSVIADLEEYYGEDAEVFVRETIKNNDCVYDGLNICFHNDGSLVPIIYLNDIYKLYEEKGYSLDLCVEEIIQIRDKNVANKKQARDILKIAQNWKYAKESVVPVLVNSEKNKKVLKDLVHRDFLDLSIIYTLQLSTENSSENATAKISKSMLERYGVSKDELHEIAMQNLQKEGYNLMDMESVIFGLLDDDCELDVSEVQSLTSGKMYICTNKKKMYGAAGILDKDFLRNKSAGRSFYIIPSSVHETIFILAEKDTDVEDLNAMIREVNVTQVRENEILADHAYYYDGVTGELSIAS